MTGIVDKSGAQTKKVIKNKFESSWETADKSMSTLLLSCAHLEISNGADKGNFL